MNKPKLDTAAVVEFVSTSSSAFTMTVMQIASELHMLSIRGAGWPQASANQWANVVREAMQSGALVFNEQGLVGPPKAETKIMQMELEF